MYRITLATGRDACRRSTIKSYPVGLGCQDEVRWLVALKSP